MITIHNGDMGLRTKFGIWASLGITAIVATTPLWAPYVNNHQPSPDLSVDIDDLPSPPSPQIIDDVIADILNEPETQGESLADFRDNFPEDKREFVDLALELEKLTGVDSYVIFAKLAIETMLDKVFALSANHGIGGARGFFQQELGNLVTAVREHGNKLDFLDNDDLEFAVTNHGRTAYVAQLPFYASYQENGLGNLSDIEQKIITEWQEYSRVSDGTLVDYIKQQVESGQFTNPIDEAIYNIPIDNVLISGQLALAHVPELYPHAMADNFTGAWKDNIDARNQATLDVYAYHNMGRIGGPVQAAIAENREWQRVTLGDRQKLEDIVQIVSQSLGKHISVAELKRNGNNNQAVFNMLDDTFYGCLDYNITTEIESHIGQYLPPVKHEWTKWHEDYCGRNAATARAVEVSIRPQSRPDNLSDGVVALVGDGAYSMIRPKARPTPGNG